MTVIFDNLTFEFEKYSSRFRNVSTIHLPELKEGIDRLRQEENISEKFYAEIQSYFHFEVPAVLPTAKSIIIIAVPQKLTLLSFIFNGKNHELVVPPTYIYGEVVDTCKMILGKVLEGTKSRIASAALPKKLLAVRSGLGKYGRNNICYVEGMGSFHRLEAFYTDYLFGEDNWQEKKVMESCNNCFNCEHSCPTKSITTERFLIYAEKCLTRLNENEGNFPQWLSPQSHNALVGCMKCQIVCPENKEFIKAKDKGEVFTEEETEMILKGIPKDELPQELYKKLKRLNMDEYYSVLPRNLSVLIK